MDVSFQIHAPAGIHRAKAALRAGRTAESHTSAPAPAPSARDRLCARVGVAATASNDEVLAALDSRLAAAPTSLAAKAGWGTPAPRPTAPVNSLAAKAGWGTGR